jgi:hypothetical protein
MRKLIAILVVLSVAWAGYWFVGSSAVQRGVETWFAEQQTRGVTAEKSTLTVRGFPNRFDVTIEDLKIADPRSGIGWEAPFAQIFALSYKPWHVIAAFPNSQVVRTSSEEILITSEKMQASARARPEYLLPLEEIRLDSTALEASSSLGWKIGAARVFFSISADPANTKAYDIGLDIADAAPDPAIIAALDGVQGLSPAIEMIAIKLNARLSAPIDRTIDAALPKLTGLEVKETQVRWGEMSLTAKGLIEPGPDGIAKGRVEFEVTNWKPLIPLMVAAGAVKPEVAPTVENLLLAMANEGGNPDQLKFPLVMEDGRMSLGPLPLGPAPSFLPPTN